MFGTLCLGIMFARKSALGIGQINLQYALEKKERNLKHAKKSNSHYLFSRVGRWVLLGIGKINETVAERSGEMDS